MTLAARCNTDVSYIGQIETGKRFPSIKLIEKIAEALDVEPYRLFKDESGIEYDEMDENEDFLGKLPPAIRRRMIQRLTNALDICVRDALAPR